ncbi:MAG: hypothetical protein ABS948_11945 [Solibacillus sp.]
MALSIKEISLYSYCIATTAVCIASTPEIIELKNSKYLSNKVVAPITREDQREDIYASWVNFEKMSYKHDKEINYKINLTNLSLEENLEFEDGFSNLIVEDDIVVGIHVEEARLDLSSHEILYFDEGPIELIEDEHTTIIHGTYAIPKESKYLI